MRRRLAILSIPRRAREGRGLSCERGVPTGPRREAWPDFLPSGKKLPSIAMPPDGRDPGWLTKPGNSRSYDPTAGGRGRLSRLRRRIAKSYPGWLTSYITLEFSTF